MNVGADAWNYQVRDLAETVAAAVPGTKVSVNTAAPPDKRSYKVDFSLYRSLAPEYLSQKTLEQSITGLRDGLRTMNFSDRDFRNSPYIRLRTLEAHMQAGRLTPDLYWAHDPGASLKKSAA